MKKLPELNLAQGEIVQGSLPWPHCLLDWLWPTQFSTTNGDISGDDMFGFCINNELGTFGVWASQLKMITERPMLTYVSNFQLIMSTMMDGLVSRSGSGLFWLQSVFALGKHPMIGSTSTSCCVHMTHFPPRNLISVHCSAVAFWRVWSRYFWGLKRSGGVSGVDLVLSEKRRAPTQPRSFPFNAPLAATCTTSKGSSNKFAFFLTRHACLFNYFSGSVKDFLEMEIDCCKFELIIIFCRLSLNMCLSLSQKYLPLQSRLVLVRSRFRNMRCHNCCTT